MERNKVLQQHVARNIIPIVHHLDKHIYTNGYMPASLTYDHYKPCWFRDSSMVSLSLIEASITLPSLRGADEEHYTTAATATDAAARQLNFLWLSAKNFQENMERGIRTPFEDPAFFNLSSHFPARVGKDGKLSSGIVNGELVKDTVENGDWLRQYDSLPLMLIATNFYIKNIGAEKVGSPIRIFSESLNTILQYLVKVYKAQSFNAWESDGHQLHSYTLSSIYRGFISALELAERLGLHIPAEIRDKPEWMSNFLYKFFVRDRILYSSKNVLRQDGSGFESEPTRKVDSSEIFTFTRFRPTSITPDIEINTMKVIEKERFRNNLLPTRFPGDTYFFGGRWILLGMEAARYYIQIRNFSKAIDILSYVEKKYLKHGNVMLPEQEIVDPESPGNDPSDYYAKNGNSPITDLAWSEGAYVSAATSLLRSAENITVPRTVFGIKLRSDKQA